jgi:hypothetical protein
MQALVFLIVVTGIPTIAPIPLAFEQSMMLRVGPKTSDHEDFVTACISRLLHFHAGIFTPAFSRLPAFHASLHFTPPCISRLPAFHAALHFMQFTPTLTTTCDLIICFQLQYKFV